jgi:hypothetical protein
MLLIAERAAILTGQDDDFVLIVTAGGPELGGARTSTWSGHSSGFPPSI